MAYENFKKYTKALCPEHLKHSKNMELLDVFTGYINELTRTIEDG